MGKGYLSPWSWILFERRQYLQLVQKISVFYGNRRLIITFIRTRHWCLTWARRFNFTHSHGYSVCSISILSFHLSIDLPNGLILFVPKFTSQNLAPYTFNFTLWSSDYSEPSDSYVSQLVLSTYVVSLRSSLYGLAKRKISQSSCTEKMLSLSDSCFIWRITTAQKSIKENLQRTA
jgi:hypothetical protein